MKPRHPKCKIIAKIENQDGIKNIDEIIDMGEEEAKKVIPSIQKALVDWKE